MHTASLALILLALTSLSACTNDSESAKRHDNSQASAPSPATLQANKASTKSLDFSDKRDFDNARRGLVAATTDLKVQDSEGNTLWDLNEYQFISGDAPDSVNPSLWRQAKLNTIAGLFKVADGLYQLRGFDLANMSLIQGDKGWIVVDPLTAKETARAAMDFAHQHLGRQNISAVIFTHSHVDHFGGVAGVLASTGQTAEQVDIIAPEHFLQESVSENVLAGTAMTRRAMFMYGKRLPRNATGHIDSGLGKAPAFGNMSILEPNISVGPEGLRSHIDGVEMVFSSAANSEAPAEMTFYLPKQKALCGAEVISRTMHNVYTLRGAKVRNALNWSRVIDNIRQHNQPAEIYFGSHHWPEWGQANIQDFLSKQRDMYKYIHDQTLRLANAGYNPEEIAETIQLPNSLDSEFYNRGYYGTLNHNSKAVYQHYFGWYDANPANLNPLPPQQAAEKYVALMGGLSAALQKAQAIYKDGDYRWGAEVLKHIVFAAPDNRQAVLLLANTYEQLGYQAESAPWRDVYLSGAFELRNGAPKKGHSLAYVEDMLSHTPLHLFFDSMAARIDGPAAEGKKISINFIFTDQQESHHLQLENSVLHHKKTESAIAADATLKISKVLFLKLVTNQVNIKDLVFSDELSIEGSKLKLIEFFLLLDKPQGVFNIVTP